jgi:hypothetical protein
MYNLRPHSGRPHFAVAAASFVIALVDSSAVALSAATGRTCVATRPVDVYDPQPVPAGGSTDEHGQQIKPSSTPLPPDTARRYIGQIAPVAEAVTLWRRAVHQATRGSNVGGWPTSLSASFGRFIWTTYTLVIGQAAVDEVHAGHNAKSEAAKEPTTTAGLMNKLCPIVAGP